MKITPGVGTEGASVISKVLLVILVNNPSEAVRVTPDAIALWLSVEKVATPFIGASVTGDPLKLPEELIVISKL